MVAWNQLESSLARGSRQVWPVYEGYEIAEGILRAKGRVKRWDCPMAHSELPGEISKLARANEGAVLDFARNYGQLCFAELASENRAWGGDPLEWIWGHANGLRICLELRCYLQEKPEVRDILNLEKFLRSLRVRDDQFGHEEHWPGIDIAVRGSFKKLSWMVLRWNRGEPYRTLWIEQLATTIPTDIINANLVGISRKLSVIDGKSRSFFHCRAPIEMAYWLRANELEACHIKRCEECGALFLQRDKRKRRFCPPRRGERQSRCAGRYHLRGHRQRL